MYDVNPLGPMMHLKELERQAVSVHRPNSPGQGSVFPRLAALLQRLGANCWPAILKLRRQ